MMRAGAEKTGQGSSGLIAKRTYVGPAAGFFGFCFVFIVMEALCWESGFSSIKSRLLRRMGWKKT